MYRSKPNLCMGIAAACIPLMAIPVGAAPIAELPAPDPNRSVLVQSILELPELQGRPILAADQFTMESLPAPPTCGACDLSAAPVEAPSAFLPIITDVPEPVTALLAAVGLGLLGILRLRAHKSI